MSHDPGHSEACGCGTAFVEKEWIDSLSAEIRGLPSVQYQIAERAYHIYLDAGLPQDAALEHWVAAENEADSWIHHAIIAHRLNPPDLTKETGPAPMRNGWVDRCAPPGPALKKGRSR